MRGTVVRRTPTEVAIDLEQAGLVSFKSDEVLSVEPEQPLPNPPTPSSEPQSTVRPTIPVTPRETRDAAEPPEGARSLPDAMKAVAFVYVAFQDGRAGFGSGTVITHKGLIATNYHVVEGAATIEVMLPSEQGTVTVGSAKRHRARVVKGDACLDLALLRVPVPTPHFVRLAPDEDIRVGFPVVAIGNPEGLTTSVSNGVISAVRSLRGAGIKLEEPIPGCEHLSGEALANFTLVQTDAAVNVGNSGGPLLNANQEVVGINTLQVTMATGLNFAIHAKHLRRFAGSYLSE